MVILPPDGNVQRSEIECFVKWLVNYLERVYRDTSADVVLKDILSENQWEVLWYSLPHELGHVLSEQAQAMGRIAYFLTDPPAVGVKN
ncbi:MAG TPA: hypothetical protein PLD54_04435, partial [Candidatus Levybacteria bacterium]|nr:hypothetical protein [Candidatus Levybacteria bacterium]